MAARELQDLSEVDMRTEWRLRDSTDDRELDAVFWPPGSDGDKQIVKVFAKSGSSKKEAFIHFTNQLSTSVRCIWIDYKGAEVVYSVLTPGQSALYKTWVGHFWIVRRTDDMTRACFQSDCQNALQEICVGKEDKQTLQIVDAPQMPPYSERTHHMFPESFKREVQQLLLCYHRAQAVSEALVDQEHAMQADALLATHKRSGTSNSLSSSVTFSSGESMDVDSVSEVEEADESGLIMFASLPKDMVLEMVGQLWGLHMLDVDPLMPRQHRDLHPIDLPEGLDSLARASGGEAVPAPSRSASRRDCLPAAGRLIGRCFSA